MWTKGKLSSVKADSTFTGHYDLKDEHRPATFIVALLNQISWNTIEKFLGMRNSDR
jgi:hypothetical protein